MNEKTRRVLEMAVDKIDNGTPTTWEEIAQEAGYEGSANYFRTQLQGEYGGAEIYKQMLADETITGQEAEQKMLELRIERRKNADSARDLRKQINAFADNEYYKELIANAIQTLRPIEIVPYYIEKEEDEQTNRYGLVVIADAHYGKSFCLRGIGGQIVNAYNGEVFQKRMEYLLAEIEKENKLFDYGQIVVADLGDCIDGILRSSSLKNLEISMVDAVIQYSEFIANWLAKLQSMTGKDIIYTLCGGNHDVVRALTSKPQFEDENLAKIVNEFIKVRLSSNEHVNVIDYETQPIITINGYSFAFAHGDSNIDIDALQNYYGAYINYLLVGHMHSYYVDNNDGGRLTIHCPSIMGTDSYAKKLGKTSPAGAMILTVNETGLAYQKIVNLN